MRMSNQSASEVGGPPDRKRRGRTPEDIRSIPTPIIDIGERMRPLDQATVEVIADSIAEWGQLQPIAVKRIGTARVRPRFKLISGHHR
jgi:ParB-like chromosome segregation protein Spo0J